MKKYVFLILLAFAAMLLGGCGGSGSDDSEVSEDMRLLERTDRITFKDQTTEAEIVFTVNLVDIDIAGSDNDIRAEIVGTIPWKPDKSSPAEWDYFKTVQLEDGSFCDIGGILSEDGKTLAAEYVNLLCPGRLESGYTWESCGVTYKVTDYQYVCDDDSDAFGAFVIKCTGAANCTVWWALNDLGFPVKCMYSDGSSTKISRYEDNY